MFVLQVTRWAFCEQAHVCRMAHIVEHKVISRWDRGHGKRANGTWPAALPTSGLDCPIAAPSHADIWRFPCWIASGRFGNYQKGALALARTFR